MVAQNCKNASASSNGSARASLPVEILGTSEGIRNVSRLVNKVAAVEDPVLIQGESGTG